MAFGGAASLLTPQHPARVFLDPSVRLACDRVRPFINEFSVVVRLADVNLAEQNIRGPYNPGAGGWPTVRYFNNVTGYEGMPYPKKTDKKMCEELGDEAYMQAYVEEMGGILLCSDFDCLCRKRPGGVCEKRELEYYEKHKEAPLSEILTKLKLLSGSLVKSGKSDPWMSHRVSILKLLAAAKRADESKQEL